MKKIIDTAYINLLEGLNLDLSLKLKNNKLGKKRSSAKGSSVEFSDYREYMAGDDYRRIDWNALARFEKVFLKLYMEEQESKISIFLDSSKSMGFDKKREISIKTAAFFAFTSIKAYDSVSTIFFSDKIDGEIRNLNTKQGFYRLASYMEEIEHSGNSELLKVIQNKIPSFKKGYTIIISDFLYEHKLDEVLSQLAFKKQKVIICHILNKDEIMPDFESNYRLKDSESGKELNVDATEYTRELYLENLNAYLKNIEMTSAKYGASYFLINTELGIEPFIHKIIKTRQGA